MKLRINAIAIGLISILTYTGCASPQVKYLTVSKEDRSGHTKFMLLASNILIAKAQEDQKTGMTKVDASNNTTQDFSQISATVVPKEDGKTLYAIVPQSSWLGLVQTNISTTFQDNTRLIKQTGISVDDNRLKAIQAVGTIAAAALVIAAPPAPPAIKVPAVIDPFEGGNKWITFPSDPNYEYKVFFSTDRENSQDKDAVAAAIFFKDYEDGGWWNSTSVLPVSSCRNIMLKIRPTQRYIAVMSTPRQEGDTSQIYNQRIDDRVINNRHELMTKLSTENRQGEKETLDAYQNRISQLVEDHEPKDTRSFPLQIADSRYVRTVRLPDKGSITAHSICGADTKTESSQIVGYQDLLAELGKQAKAVYDTQKGKK